MTARPDIPAIAASALVSGLPGPKSNARGPNEFLHVPYAKKVAVVTAMVIAAVR